MKIKEFNLAISTNYIFICFLFLASCSERSNKFNINDLKGDWFQDTWGKNYNEENTFPNETYNFINDSIVDTKIGFHKITFNENDYKNRKYKFLGTKTKYMIEQDSLKMFNLVDSTWYSRKIITLSPDSLILLASPNNIQRFYKFERSIDSIPKFNMIALYASGCYGKCPSLKILIEDNGNVTFYGIRYTEKEGLYKSSITRELYDEFQNKFRYVLLRKYEESNELGYADAQEITAILVKDNFIYKSFLVNSISIPRDLEYAIIPIKHLHYSLNLKEIPKDSLSFQSKYEYSGFKSNNEIWQLTGAEDFLLYKYLMNAKISKQRFKGEYKLIYTELYNADENILAQILTDGQYYKYILSNGSYFTLDIGFNFINNNQSIVNFKQILPKAER
jgi:hypothetical protein